MNSASDERRSCHRNKVFKSGQYSPDGRLSVYDCLVRDISERGAHISVETQQAVPDQFFFWLRGEARNVPAKVIWRHGRELGIALH